MLSWCQKNVGLYEEGRKSAGEALKIAEEINFQSGIAEANNMIGVNYVQQGDYHKALEYYHIALRISQDMNDKRGLASSYNNIALIYYGMGNFGKALEYFAFAVKLNKETDNKRWLSNNYNNIGNVYADKGDQDLALENYLLAKRIKEELKQTSDPQYANTVNNIGNIYFSKLNYNKALELFNEALAIRERIGDIAGVAGSYISLGSLYFEQMKTERDSTKRELLYEKALENFTISEKMDADLGDDFGVALSRLNKGSVYLKKNKTDAARKELVVAFNLFKESNANDLTKDACLLLAQCDSIDGNWKSAYEYHKLYKQFSDSIFSEENSKKIAEMSARFETEKNVERIDQLEKEKKRTTLFGIIFVVLVMGVFYFGKRAYDNKKKVADFMRTENERKEVLIQEVHHRINNNLQIISSLLSLQASSAEDERLNEYLRESQNRIQSLSALHELLYQTDHALKVNMPDYFSKILDFHKEVLSTLPAEVDLQMDIADANFTTRTSVPLALIVNELVTNSIKHAFKDNKKGFIRISLQQSEKDTGTWKLMVTDSGKGLPESTGFRKNSLGLRLVKIMTKQLHGTLVTSNTPGATFEITFNLNA